MDKLDLKKKYKAAFSAKPGPQIVTIPPIKYLTFSGKGNPNTSRDFNDSMGVLYGLAYTLKFAFKEQDKDFVISPLEGQWWGEDMDVFVEDKKDEWLWKVAIAIPDYIGEEDFSKAKESLRVKKDPPQLDKASMEIIEDGLAVQVLYYGPYSQEAAAIAAMHAYANEQGYRLRGKHREVYLSPPQRTPPEKLKTIIRQPIEKK